MSGNLDEGLKPLNITCTSTDCDNGLHCFKQKQKMKKKLLEEGGANSNGEGGEKIKRGGRCRECGVDLVDWERIADHNLNDTVYTFEALKKELIRHYYWHLAIDQRAKNHALRKGSIEMYAYVEKRLRISVGLEKPFRDGIQTKAHQSGNIVNYAQHATASCCRVCIEIWHGIPRGRALMDSEIEYFTELAMQYIKERLPELTFEGQKIPHIRRGRNNDDRS